MTTPIERQCRCVNANHVGGRCVNTAYMHRFCGPCQSEGAVELVEPSELDDFRANAAELLRLYDWRKELDTEGLAIALLSTGATFTVNREEPKRTTDHVRNCERWERAYEAAMERTRELLTRGK